jgi:hypothetical protein
MIGVEWMASVGHFRAFRLVIVNPQGRHLSEKELCK